ncbi:MAG: transcriptional regulator [Acidiphilium sp. 21-66-27]|nr:MAG: transcriptional regulator [Acidiphilium sp. 21-66-27]
MTPPNSSHDGLDGSWSNSRIKGYVVSKVNDHQKCVSPVRPDGPLEPIGKVARHIGCGIDTIRFYEKIGVLRRPRRTGSGRRVYGPAEISRLAFICRARELGFSLDEVRGLLDIAEGKERPCEEAKQAAIRHRQDVRRKISDLRVVEATLGTLIRQCEAGGAVECPLIEALSQPSLAVPHR